MKYVISKTTAPNMPNLGRGLESVALLLSQVSKDMHQPIVPMLFPILGAHVSGAEFMYPDLSWKEPSGMLANLVADSGAGKGQLSSIVEAVCRDFRTHDDEELAKLVEWQKMMKTKSANKEKPTRRGVLVSACRRHQRSLHPERHGMRETRTAHTIPQHARGGNGRPRLRRTPTDFPNDA